ncbi:hypothetical protein [Reyranella sp.]|uniref:hypothetical protein n=1 Tax=Reyranella sp. TaxID=1929291 RepID=UPI002730C802|nr:hypothetical protein [Reyranella sp.]MDP2372203.1 hypothetical protein [Reyranella sp.]
MENFITWLNGYSNLITAASTVVLAALTAFLWFENRGLRKAGSAPQVVAYLLAHPDGNGAVQFILANIGKGPAFAVKFSLICDEADFDAHDVLLRNDAERMPMAVLPQDEILSSLFGIGFKLFGLVGDKRIAPLKPFSVSIEYHDVLGRKSKSQRVIDIKQFAGLAGITAKSNERQVAQSLEKIERHLATIARQSSRFNAFVDVTQLSDEWAKKAKGAE